jgi:threonine dehydratase
MHEAAGILRGRIVETPCAHSVTLSEITGAQVILKFENLQFTASFKERGALVKLLSLTPEERGAGVVAASAGNHALAVAHHARDLGIRATIVMPRFTPNVKVEHTRALGAEVILHGAGFDEAHAFARELERERRLVFVHPYDDARVIAGQGTTALEMLSAHPDLDALVIPIGGGGLIAGCAIAAKAIAPAVRIFGVQTEQFPSMRAAIQGTSAEYGAHTIAEGIAVKEPGKLTLPVVRELVEEIFLVDEDVLEEAVLLLLEVEKTVVEGAGAAGLAALLRNRERFEGKRVGLILSGGNIDLMILSSIIERGLVRSGRLVRLEVEVRDVPGALADVTKCIGDADANIVQVHHRRAFTTAPLAVAEVELVLQTRGREHAREVVERLRAAGYEVRAPDRVDPNASARASRAG